MSRHPAAGRSDGTQATTVVGQFCGGAGPCWAGCSGEQVPCGPAKGGGEASRQEPAGELGWAGKEGGRGSGSQEEKGTVQRYSHQGQRNVARTATQEDGRIQSH